VAMAGTLACLWELSWSNYYSVHQRVVLTPHQNSGVLNPPYTGNSPRGVIVTPYF